MTLPADPPKLPKWPFLVGDGALVALAWIIAHQSPAPLPPLPLICVVACVVIGAVLATYPFVIEYTRAQEIALDDRQKALETLSVTVATSAEQISIAANGLHEITELAQRNIKVAEQLPAKIHERIAAITAGFEDSRSDDREELQRELATLRATQTDKLADIADSIARSVSDLATLHLSAQRQISASADVITRASATLAPFDAQISATIQRAEKVFAAVPHPRADDRRGHAVNLPEDTTFLDDPPAFPAAAAASAPGSSPVTEGVAEGLLPPMVAAAPSQPVETSGSDETGAPQTAEQLISADPFTAAIMSVLEPEPTEPDAPRPEVLAPAEPAPIPSQTIPEIVPVAPRDSASLSPILLPADTRPMRRRAPRKPKVPVPYVEPTPTTDESPAPPVLTDSDLGNDSGSSPAVTVEPHPIESTPEPAAATEESIVVTTPISAPDAEPVSSAPEPEPALAPTPEPAEPTSLAQPDVTEPSEPEIEPVKIAPPMEATEPAEMALSSDGATRLLVTAYIGIGNRLFIRGDGAGLSWEKGVPLQFISIGKWRWETHETTAPIGFKLFKNDAIECAELGVQTLEPGSQHEVTAKF